MEPKWSRNGEKGVQPDKMVPRWLPGATPYEDLVDFEPLLGPFGPQKIDLKRDLGRKWGHWKRHFIDFSAFAVCSSFLT